MKKVWKPETEIRRLGLYRPKGKVSAARIGNALVRKLYRAGYGPEPGALAWSGADWKGGSVKKGTGLSWNLGLQNVAEVRIERGPEAGDVVSRSWHHDGMEDHLIAAWANKLPTKVKSLNGKMIPLKPFELVVFGNLRYRHKGPVIKDHLSSPRYFFRMYVRVKKQKGRG